MMKSIFKSIFRATIICATTLFLVIAGGAAGTYYYFFHLVPAMGCSALNDIALSKNQAKKITTVLEGFLNSRHRGHDLRAVKKHPLFRVNLYPSLDGLAHVKLKWSQEIRHAVVIPGTSVGNDIASLGHFGVWVNRGYIVFDASYDSNDALVLDESSSVIECDAASKLFGPR